MCLLPIGKKRKGRKEKQKEKKRKRKNREEEKRQYKILLHWMEAPCIRKG